MLTLARESGGLTQGGLSESTSVSQSKISKIEDGLLSPSDEDVKAIAHALNRPIEFFYQVGKPTSSAVSFYRKTTSLPSSTFKQCNAQMNIRRLEIQSYVRGRTLSKLPIPYLPLEKFGSPSAAAQELRKQWKLPVGPVKNLTSFVEAAGCVIVHFEFETKKLDGLCLWTEGDIPFIFLNRQFPAGRMRLTLAHELGHLVMHRAPHENVENEAWEFAAEFLMPAAAIGRDLYPLNLGTLADLKRKWGVSMQAIIQRAEALGKTSERYSRYLWMQMGKSGYRIQEPYDDTMEREEALLVRELEKRGVRSP
jgi:Zn-dependent peptidase ImmA (M78 family)/transcriptional regulator with XRE-family HTH domain